MKNILKKILKKFLFKKKIDTVETDHYYPKKLTKYNKIIPNNFFQTYKSKTVDIEYNKKIKEFRDKNPSFNYYFFDDIDCEKFMEKHWGHRKIYEIYKNSIYGASKADIWRYCVLFTYGGVYLDFDSSIQFQLDEIPNDVDEIISFEKNLLNSQISNEYTPDFNFLSKQDLIGLKLDHPNNIVIQWLLIYKKEHPILLNVINEIEKNVDFFANKTFESCHLAIVNFTAPVILTKAVWDYILSGKKVHQKGIDYNEMVKFKDVSKEGVYSNDNNYYKKFSQTKILDTNQIRLNLSFGEFFKRGFININLKKKIKSEINIEINDLTKIYNNGSVSEIFIEDVIEYVGLDTTKIWMKQWSEVLTINGTVTISTPCSDLITKAYENDKINDEKLKYLLFNGKNWKDKKSHLDKEKISIYDLQKLFFSKKQMKELLVQNNFEIITENFDSIESNINSLNMVIKAKKIEN